MLKFTFTIVAEEISIINACKYDRIAMHVRGTLRPEITNAFAKYYLYLLMKMNFVFNDFNRC